MKMASDPAKKRLILLDAHAILHRAYHALPDFATAKGEPTGALYGLSTMVIKIIEDLKPDYIVACYDVKGPTYRHEVYQAYKAQRKVADDDLIVQMNRSRDIFMALNIPIYDKQGFEADDMLGTIVEQLTKKSPAPTGQPSGECAHSPLFQRGTLQRDSLVKEGEIQENIHIENHGEFDGKSPFEKGGGRQAGGFSEDNAILVPPNLEIIIASGDMDTLQLVKGEDVKVFTLKKGIKDTIMYDEKAVRERFGFGPELIPDYKGLRGDPSDNIIGVKGIGDKTATILITAFGSIENIYHELENGGEEKFKKAGISPRIIQLLKDNKEEAEFSKMLATIRRDCPISFVLPEKTFKENLDVKKISSLWHELEFRTLTQRLEKVVEEKSPAPRLIASEHPLFQRGTLQRDSLVKGGEIQENIHLEDHGESDGKSLFGKGGVSTEGRDGGFSEDNGGTENSTVDSALDSRLPSFAEATEGKRGNDKREDLDQVSLALWLVNSTITNPKIEDILNFANTENFDEAKEAIFKELDKKDLRKVYDKIELPLIPVIKKMEERGVKIDRVILKNLAETYHAELSKLEKKIHELAGMEFNINSPKQLGEVLFDKLQLTAKNMKKTSGGARSTRESELEKLKDLHPIVPLLFEYRELAKLLSTYIDAIPPLLDANDRLHSNFVSSGTTTGRMASINPNLQNIPVKSDLGKAIRNAFIAEKGFSLCGFDYSQMELRIAAFLSGDEKLIEIFKKGEDVHTSVASSVFKVPMNEVTSTMRRQAKVINFGIIYGMGVMALKQNLGTTRDEAQKFLNDYFETFSTLAKYLNDVKIQTAERGYTETFFGRRRYFEGINSKIPYIKASAERMAINAPIQGTEADVIKLAMVAIDKFIVENKLEKDIFPLLQVHDELIYEIREDKAAEIAPKIEKIMEFIMDPKDTKGIILKAEAAVGKNWGEL